MKGPGWSYKMFSPLRLSAVLFVQLLAFGAAAQTTSTDVTTPTAVDPQQNRLEVPQITNSSERLQDATDKDKEKSPTSGASSQSRTPATGQPAVSEEKRRDAPSEFQEFIFQTTGRRLPLFGYDLFDSVPSTFAPLDRVPVPTDYVIGPGDELLLRGWGSIDINYHGTIDRNGDFFLPRVGSIRVAGLKYQQLQPFLKSNIQRVFRDFDLVVSLGQLRSIQVFVVGQARRPGSYTVGSLSTLVNALFASGGPSTRGSMRHIQLKRNNALVTELDLYDLLVSGDKSRDSSLLPGDVIFIPPVGKVVAIEGSVNSPAIYEIRDDTRLGDLLKLAGGLTPTASAKDAVVERLKDRSIKTMSQITLDALGLQQMLSDGDLVTINSLSARFENAITLRGNVSTPGRFEWKQGVRVSDIIPDREALITRNFWQMQNNLVKKERQGNSILVQTIDEPKEQSDVNREKNVDSNVNQKGKDTGQTVLTNQIRRLAPDINWDYAVVQRLNRQELTTQLLPFNLAKAIEAGANNPDDIVLLPGDVITIFSQADIRVPIRKQNKFVRLEGEFQKAGVYEVELGETLRHLLERVGGLTPQAYLYGSEFLRESTRIAQQERLDKFVQQLEKDVETNASVQAQNVSSVEEAAGLPQKLDSQRRLVEKLKAVKASGRLVLGISPTAAGISDIPDIPLEDGDRFIVPFMPAVVNVVGAVYNETSLIHQPQRRVSYYLRKVGGGTARADKAHTFVVRADGSVASGYTLSGWFTGGGIGDVKLLPGDTIVVPQRLDKTSVLKELKDWSFVVGQLALGAAALHSLTN